MRRTQGGAGRAITREQMRVLHAKRRSAILSSPCGNSRSSAGDVGTDPPRQSADLDSAGPRSGLHGLISFTVLLHEVLHHLVFEKRHPVAERVLAWRYAIPSGIAASQFTRWHLIITPSWDRLTTIRSGTTCRRRSTPAGTNCCTPRRCCFRFISGPRDSNQRPIPTTCARRFGGTARGDRLSSGRARVIWGRSVFRRPSRRHHSVSSSFRLRSSSIASDSTTTSSQRSRQVGTLYARQLVGISRHQLELSPRASLFPGVPFHHLARRCSARSRPFYAQKQMRCDISGTVVRVARGKQDAAHGLESSGSASRVGGWRVATSPATRDTTPATQPHTSQKRRENSHPISSRSSPVR